MILLYYVVVAAAIAAMLVGLALALRLRRLTRGGQVGRVVNVMLVLILLFTAGYAVAPFMPRLSPELGWLVMSLIYLFGALYVILVLWLIGRLVQQVMQALELES